MKTKILLLTAAACLFGATASMAQTVPSYVPTNGLVGWWPFNSNANDESGNGNNGVVSGTPFYINSRNNQSSSALRLSGLNDNVSLNAPDISTLTNSVSFSIWIKKDQPYTYSSLFFLKNGTAYSNGFNVSIDQNDATMGSGNFRLAFAVANSPNINVVIPLTQLQNWNNLTGTYDGSVIKLFLNGNLVSSGNFSGSINPPNSNLLFSDWDNPSPPSTPERDVDDIGIWNRALTQQEITALYQSNNCSVPAYVPTNGLVGYWPFCGNANDVSGNGNNGAVNGATLTTDRNGNTNEAYSFDGVDDFIESTFSQFSEYTISAWVRINDTTKYYHGFFQHKQNCARGGGMIVESQNNNFRMTGDFCGFCPTNTCAINIDENNISNILKDNWYHVTLTSNGLGTFKMFVNGLLKRTVANSSAIANYGIAPFSIGKHHDGVDLYYLEGFMDEVGYWSRELTSLEIQQLFNSTPCTKPDPVTLGTDRATKLCPNEAVTIEIVTPSTAGLSYEWTRNGTTIPGATASSISVSDAAKYKVFVRSGPGLDCQRVSGLIETTAAIPPTITATTPNGNAYCPGDSVLMSATGITPGYSYQWKRFGVPIAGATSATFYAKQTGNYRCEVTNAGGCINQSNLVSIVNGTSCRIMQDQPSDVNVYPNPAKSSFTVSFNDIGNETPVSIELRNLQGQSIENRKLNGLSDVQFNVGKLSPGMYMVRVMLEGGDVVEKSVMVE